MINPAQIVSMTYETNQLVNKKGEKIAKVIIQMSNQSNKRAYVIDGKCDSIEQIVQELIDIVRKINNPEQKSNKKLPFLDLN